MTNRQEERIKALETMSVLAGACALAAAVSGKAAFIYAALLLLACGLFFKQTAAAITRLWLKFAELLGTVTNRVILTVVFYLAVTPVALLYRLFSSNPLGIKKEPGSGSFYKNREHLYAKTDFENMW